MFKPARALLIVAVAGMLTASAFGQRSRDKIEIVTPKSYAAPVFETSSAHQAILAKASNDVRARYPNGRDLDRSA